MRGEFHCLVDRKRFNEQIIVFGAFVTALIQSKRVYHISQEASLS